MPAGTTRRFTPTSLRSIRTHFINVILILWTRSEESLIYFWDERCRLTQRCLRFAQHDTLFKRLASDVGTCFVCSLYFAPAIALALPDDATLSRLLVGTWKGPRHETQYRADGTWVLDPPDEGDNTRGKWRIEHGRLIETWRLTDETEDSSSVEEIIELTEKIFKSRIILQEGPGKPEGQVLPSETFTVTRVTEKN